MQDVGASLEISSKGSEAGVAMSTSTIDGFVDYFLTLAGGCIHLRRLHYQIQDHPHLRLRRVHARDESLQPVPCNMFDPTAICEKVKGRNRAILFSGLYLVALGSGGLKAALPALGAEQFDEQDPKERRHVSSFFNFFLFSMCVGSSLGVTFLVWIQNNRGWDKALTISSSSILLGLVCIAFGYPKYRNRVPSGSPLTRIARVLVAAFRNRNHDLPENQEELYHEEKRAKIMLHYAPSGDERLPHTSQFEFLDKAAIADLSEQSKTEEDGGDWELSNVTQTFSVQQGTTMDKKLESLDIPLASLPIIPMAFIVALTPIYDRVFVPFAWRLTGLETGITHLHRVGVGLPLSRSKRKRRGGGAQPGFGKPHDRPAPHECLHPELPVLHIRHRRPLHLRGFVGVFLQPSSRKFALTWDCLLLVLHGHGLLL
ncbi:hypothetical protein H6P81_003656 [Aristolochia fimbriata]|uniref:Uncharacterized protein n=1 Tax=Aristolochia fimbriata TaxID=158543 RepID=A0AAV7FE24_ARIFI|nr:hypothetical protein H6P81_003656 [Aristolochia fimbriata]